MKKISDRLLPGEETEKRSFVRKGKGRRFSVVRFVFHGAGTSENADPA
jgi:hypothetical protein